MLHADISPDNIPPVPAKRIDRRRKKRRPATVICPSRKNKRVLH